MENSQEEEHFGKRILELVIVGKKRPDLGEGTYQRAVLWGCKEIPAILTTFK